MPKAYLGIPNLLVLTVTTEARRLARIQEKLAAPNEWSQFLFRAVAPMHLLRPLTGLLHEPWERAELPPLHIGESR
jgi:hypothetical protein